MFINYKSFSQASRICQFYRTPYVIVHFLLIRETKVSSILERETVEKTLQREHIHEFCLGSWIFYKTKQIFWWSHNQGILFFHSVECWKYLLQSPSKSQNIPSISLQSIDCNFSFYNHIYLYPNGQKSITNLSILKIASNLKRRLYIRVERKWKVSTMSLKYIKVKCWAW